MSTPSDPNVTLRKDDSVSQAVNPVVYQSMNGSLLVAAVGTKIGISHIVGVTSKFSSKPEEAHLTGIKRIYQYLRGSLDITIKYKKSEFALLIGYTDADYAGDMDD